MITKFKLFELAYPTTFDFNVLKNIKSYSGKIAYVGAKLQKIASGSSRTVYKIDDEKVLKFAKNEKGLEQNLAESEAYKQNYDIVARVFDCDPDDYWIEMELAKKVKPTRFKELTKLSIDELNHYFLYLRNMNSKFGGFGISDEVKEKVENNDWFNDLQSFIFDYDLPTGDFGRLSSYGEVLRDGKPTIVLIDFGLTKELQKEYHKKR